MERSGRTALPFLLALALAACSSVPRPDPIDPAAVGSARFPGADGILAGFDPAEAGAEWRAGDRVLYALSTECGGETRSRLIEIELLRSGSLGVLSAPEGMTISQSVTLTATVGGHTVRWSSPVLHVAVRVFEADGELEQSTEADVPETVLRSGLHPTLELFSALGAPNPSKSDGAQPLGLSDEETRTVGEGLATLQALLGILQDDQVLQSLLMQVVGPPPLLSIFQGIHVGLNCDFNSVRRSAGSSTVPCASGSIQRLPVQISVNDAPTLDLEIEVAVADPPLRMCGGILSMTGVSCRGPERKVTLELLAAHRGPAGAEIRL